MIRLDNVVGAEYDPVTTDADAYSAPSDQVVSDQQAAITALEAAVLALANKIRTITATTTLVIGDKTILADATSAAIVTNLPAAASTVGQIITVKKIDASVNTVTIDPNASELIDGATTNVLSTQWASLTFQSNGTSWFII